MARARRRRGVVGFVARCVFFGATIVLLGFVALFTVDSVGKPISMLMIGRTLQGKTYERDYVRLDAVAPVVVASVIASEDARFCHNAGVDWDALHQVISEADEDGPSRGASTITMQVAKNLFLWPGRSAIRKGLEIAIATVLGKVWSKAHTIEVYLNIAEWGDGIFGIEAAARRHFGKPAAGLDAREAALLATALPNPILRDAGHPRPLQRRLAARLISRTNGNAAWLDCLPR